MTRPSPLVTYYHSVAPEPFEGWPLRFLTMRMDRFEQELDQIVERGWRTIFMDEWWRMRTGKEKQLGSELCITFDDGLLDNWVYAFPLVKKRGLKMTLFVCPELIEDADAVRPNLEDVWNGSCRADDLLGLGQLSWGELRAMQCSGHVDIQSHTMTHTKHIVSGELRGAYYGGFAGYYPALNTYTLERKPRYMADPGFSQRIPIGTPLFAENSAVVARRKTICEDFLHEAASLAQAHDLSRAEERPVYEQRLRDLHLRYGANGGVIQGEESFQEHVDRVEYEIIGSKREVEKRLDKPVEFLCWPHGGNSPATHEVAKQAGYLATTVGKMTSRSGDIDRILRTGTDWPLSLPMRRLKFDAKMGAAHGRQPFRAVAGLNDLKNRLLGKD
jgi:peptidoglycan/xylan/chitin deacetylase (PgdA/CDA1 family)